MHTARMYRIKRPAIVAFQGIVEDLRRVVCPLRSVRYERALSSVLRQKLAE
jgi:hypothetical protein